MIPGLIIPAIQSPFLGRQLIVVRNFYRTENSSAGHVCPDIEISTDLV
jgi:hypothetical protein